jgi:replication-associated recombination protein RarA
MTPEEFIKNGPKVPDDLIGKARNVARVFYARAKKGSVLPIKLLCYGKPGIGKSAVCKIIANALASHPSTIRHISAGQVTAEQVREWMAGFHYHYDAWQVFWIEEVDAVNPAVEVMLLQFLDELPDRHAVLATSNEQMSGISQRFQSRCHAIRFEPPSVDIVADFLQKRWPELGITACEIAEANAGDVRASLNDAQGQLDCLKYGVEKEGENHE